MDDLSVEDRIFLEAEYIVNEKATIRSTALKFGVSKSAVHKDVSFKLRFLDERLYNACNKVLKENLSARHIRGGNATKRKYELIRKGLASIAAKRSAR